MAALGYAARICGRGGMGAGVAGVNTLLACQGQPWPARPNRSPAQPSASGAGYAHVGPSPVLRAALRTTACRAAHLAHKRLRLGQPAGDGHQVGAAGPRGRVRRIQEGVSEVVGACSDDHRLRQRWQGSGGVTAGTILRLRSAGGQQTRVDVVRDGGRRGGCVSTLLPPLPPLLPPAPAAPRRCGCT